MQEKNNEATNKMIIYIHGIHRISPSQPFVDFFKKRQKLSSIEIDKPGKFGTYELENGSPFLNLTTHRFYWARTKEERGGILSQEGRYEAAQYLFKDLTTNQEYKDKEISIFAHSHGGNVATELLRIIGEENSNLKIKNLIFYETPKGKITEEGINAKVESKYVAENVFDINLDYQPNYESQQKEKFIQIIDIFHQFPRCFRTFFRKRTGLKDILLKGEKLTHNSTHLIELLLKDLLNNNKIDSQYNYYLYDREKFNVKNESFHANNVYFQCFCYYILPYLIKSLQYMIIYKLLMKYDKKYNLGIKENIINKINLLKKKYKPYS